MIQCQPSSPAHIAANELDRLTQSKIEEIKAIDATTIDKEKVLEILTIISKRAQQIVESSKNGLY